MKAHIHKIEGNKCIKAVTEICLNVSYIHF